jgi:flagellar protein FliO/FliZ
MNKYIRILGCFLILTILFTTNLFAAPNAAVIWKYVNLREAPKEDAQIITVLVKGVKLTILKDEGEWCKIKSEEEIVGWLVKRSLKVVKPLVLDDKVKQKKEPAAAIKSTKIKEEDITGTSIKSKKPVVVKADKSVSGKIRINKPATGKKELLTYKEKAKVQKKSYDGKSEPELKKPSKETSEEKAEDVGYLKPASGEMPETPSLTGAFIRMISALLIILGAILLLFYVVRRYFSKSILSLEGSSAITVLASKYIGQKSILYMIDVMEKIIVVAISNSEIKMLTEISDTAAIERMRKEIALVKENEKPFKRFFSDKIKTRPESSARVKEESFDMLDDLNEKLKKKADDLKI